MFNRGRGDFRGGFGGGFERGFGFDRGMGPGRHGPRFERGGMKLVILDLLKEKPRHGYDIIQELKQKFGGFYTPSAGTIYPTLQLLEDQDMVRGEEKDGKKVYTVTEQGLAYLTEHAEEVDAMHERMRGPWGENAALGQALREEFGETANVLFTSAADKKLNPAQLEKIHEAFKALREELQKIIAEE